MFIIVRTTPSPPSPPFHLLMDLVPLCCTISRKMKKKKNKTITSRLSLYDFKIMKKEIKKEKEMGMIRIDFATK